MSTIPLIVSASAVAGSDGAGGTTALARISPTIYGVKWNVTRINIATNSTVTSRFYLYQNIESAGTLIDGSYNGEQDTSETNIKLQTLDTLIGKWVGASSGAICTMTITGTQEDGR